MRFRFVIYRPLTVESSMDVKVTVLPRNLEFTLPSEWIIAEYERHLNSELEAEIFATGLKIGWDIAANAHQ